MKHKVTLRSVALIGMVFGILAVYILRLIDWQILNGADTRKKADATSASIVTMDAARGEILDIHGNPLAANKTGYAIQFERPYMPRGTENETIRRLTNLLNGRKEQWTDELPIFINAADKYEFLPDSEAAVERLKGKDYADLNSYATAEDCMNALIEKYEIDPSYTQREIRNVASVRYNMVKSGFNSSTPYIFAPDISGDTVGIVSENTQLLPGASIKITTARTYPSGDIGSNLIGTMGPLSQEQYDAKKDEGYAYNDRMGQSGTEAAFEKELRGKAGEKQVETTSRGGVASETVIKPPESGHTLYLTLDSNLQKVAQVSLDQNVIAARENGQKLAAKKGGWNGQDCVLGTAVVLRVKDNAVLAAAGNVNYDLGKYMTDTAYKSEVLKDPDHPLVNQAFNGIFTPGSCFKPAVAAAALQEGIITNNTTFHCAHVYQRFADVNFTPKCLGTHGTLSLRRAISESCNIFFFETGFYTGIETMNLYSKRFGLGVKTGVELNESAGILAGKEYSASVGKAWVQGDTVQAAIGQSDNQFTTLQLAAYASTIANNGVRYQTHIVDKITDYTRKTTIMENDPNNPVIAAETGVSQENMDYIKAGMRAVITENRGSAHRTLGSYPVPIAGKTGTAQGPGSDNVAFIGFAPYDDPEVAVAVVLQHGATGTYCQQVVKDLLDAYFYGKTVDEEGNLVMPEDQSASSTASGVSSGQDGTSSSGETPQGNTQTGSSASSNDASNENRPVSEG